MLERMMKNNYDIPGLRVRLQSIAFLMTQDGKNKEAHDEIVKVISGLSKIELSDSQLAGEEIFGEIEAAEVKKVSRKLKLWAKRPSQINSQILTAYLTLKRAGVKRVTEKN